MRMLAPYIFGMAFAALVAHAYAGAVSESIISAAHLIAAGGRP